MMLINLLNGVTTSLQFVKNLVSMKCNKMKHNKISMPIIYSIVENVSCALGWMCIVLLLSGMFYRYPLFSWLIVLFEVSVFLLIFGQVGHILPVFVYVGLKATPDSLYWNVFYGGCVGTCSISLISERTGSWVTKASHMTFADFNLYP